MKKQRFKIFTIVMGMVLLFSPAALAATITQEYTFSDEIPSFYNDYTFNQFDPSLGILNSISITLDLTTAGGSLSVDNDADTASMGDSFFGSYADLSSTDVTLLGTSPPFVWEVYAQSSHYFSLDPQSSDPGLDGGDINNMDFTGPDGAIFNAGNSYDTIMNFVNPAVFSDYIGTGTFDITLFGDNIALVGALGGVQFAVDPPKDSGFVRIIYDYTTPVPEPATMMLFGVGLLGIAGASRKKLMGK